MPQFPAALSQVGYQLGFQLLKLAQLDSNCRDFDFMVEQLPHRIAGSHLPRAKLHQIADLAEGEARLLHLPREVQVLNVSRGSAPGLDAEHEQHYQTLQSLSGFSFRPGNDDAETDLNTLLG
jgi:hypothetical protein